MSVAFIDVETRSTENLKQIGSRKYLDHPDTELLSLVCKYEEKFYIWLPANVAPAFTEKLEFPNTIVIRSVDLPPELDFILDHAEFCVAHNATFDRHAVERFCNKYVKWVDTMPKGRAGGYPGQLNDLSKWLLGQGKDEGSSAMHMLSNVRIVAGKKKPVIGTAALWQSMLHYNLVDVILLEAVYHKVKNFGDDEFIEVADKINRRGIYIDKQLAYKMLILYMNNEITAAEKLPLYVGDINIRSHQQVKKWLEEKGYKVDSLNKQQLEAFFENPLDYSISEVADDNVSLVIEALRLRQEVARAGKGKLSRLHYLLDTDTDRIYDQFVTDGAHTGRFTGRGFQPHNFARGTLSPGKYLPLIKEKSYDELVEICSKDGVTLADVLASVTRCTLAAPPNKFLGIADYAQVECRMLAYLAKETKLLQMFRDGVDIYKNMASKVYGIPTENIKDERQVGKVIILGAGYGMSWGRFQAYAEIQERINLTAAGVTAKQCIDSFREEFPRISGGLNGPRSRSGIWQIYHDMAHRTISLNSKEEFNGIKFYMEQGAFVIELLSGRKIYYRNAKVADRIPGYCKLLGIEPTLVPTIVYSHPHGYEGILYGGLITENVVQASTNDLLRDALKRCDKNYFVTFHAHDEIMTEMDHEEQLKDFCNLVAEPSSWCKDFPMKVEGFAGKHYSKKPFKEFATCEVTRYGQLQKVIYTPGIKAP